MSLLNFSLFLLSLIAWRVSASSNCFSCKCHPGTTCWPSDDDFARLNQSVSGQLIRTHPPASVCYTDEPNYNEAACQVVLSNWYDAAFHSRDPTSVGSPIWAGNPCPPIYLNGTSVTGDPVAGSKGCHVGGYPAFAINATEPLHVQEAVRFARKHNIRLNIKNTGHSFQGRSTAYGSLSIYTFHYKGIRFHENFQPENCPSQDGHMAASLGAGETVDAVYAALAKHNAVAVAGSARTVGVVGWFSGGGHGPLSSDYGMGADNVLQVTLVTPSGDIVTANSCQHDDLFWAIRGGGGSTFGVILEVVMKAYPSPKTDLYVIQAEFTSPDALENWRNIAYLHSKMPRLKEGGLQGYYGAFSTPAPGTLGFQLAFYAYDKPNGTVEALFASVRERLDEQPQTVSYTASSYSFPNFFEAWSAITGFEPVAQSGTGFGSWLLPAGPLTANVDRLAEAFQKATAPREPSRSVIMIGHMIATSKNADLDIAMLPAWRNTVTHLVLVEPFPDYVDTATRESVYHDMTYKRVPILKILSPNSGAYHNEGDPLDPNFKQTFWGNNYGRLEKIKAKYDPSGLLWCLACVGSDAWSLLEDGRLCKNALV
jgi:FAD/FMN-containing dehydrogenase